VPQSVLKSAQCVSIFPNVVTVALAVGGTHGDGVAFCKDAAGRWAGPVFMDVTGGSLGLQMGAKAVDTVIFYTGARAKAAIEEGRFTLSGELDAVAGKFEESFTPPAVGAVSYMRSEGAFIGASLTGMSVYTDKGTMKAFYGAKAGQERVFELAPPESVAPRVNALRELLPKAG
jgi:lipid-binding SYLF domain-containing protein